MVYTANALKVMIASPSDVEKERRLVRDLIQEWNYVNSEGKSLVLMPVGWETHSVPSMDGTAQEIINKEVLADCDLLVAIFWTRIGTPTEEAESGTVEEIREHIKSGKPAMIYFSSEPVALDSVDNEQYSRLIDFKKELKKQGLIENYSTLSEFHRKFSRQLAQTIINKFSDEHEDTSIADQFSEFPNPPTISDDAKEVLLFAVQEGNGTILTLRSLTGYSVQVGGKEFVERGNSRSEARWKKAIEILVGEDYIRDRGYKGEVFEVTADGYEYADKVLF